MGFLLFVSVVCVCVHYGSLDRSLCVYGWMVLDILVFVFVMVYGSSFPRLASSGVIAGWSKWRDVDPFDFTLVTFTLFIL